MTSDSLSLVRLLGTDAELDVLQKFLALIPAQTRAFISDPEARHLFAMLPPGKSPDSKFLYGAFESGELIGCLDLISGFPDETFAYVGLLALAHDRQGRGAGRAAWRLAESIIASWGGIKKARLGVTLGNDAALSFWKALGFVATGETSVSRDGGSEVPCLLLEKPLDAHR